MALPRSQFGNRVESFQVLSGFSKSAGKWLSCGIKVRLWRRAQLCIGRSDSFSGMASGDVCVGDHWLDVMNRWEVLTMKIRCPRFGESRPSLRDRTDHSFGLMSGLIGRAVPLLKSARFVLSDAVVAAFQLT